MTVAALALWEPLHTLALIDLLIASLLGRLNWNRKEMLSKRWKLTVTTVIVSGVISSYRYVAHKINVYIPRLLLCMPLRKKNSSGARSRAMHFAALCLLLISMALDKKKNAHNKQNSYVNFLINKILSSILVTFFFLLIARLLFLVHSSPSHHIPFFGGTSSLLVVMNFSFL